MSLARLLWLIFCGILVTALGVYSLLTVYYSNLPFSWLRLGAAIVVAVPLLFLGWNSFLEHAWRARAGFIVLVAGIAGWWFLIPASHDRDWQEQVGRMPTVEIEGNRAIVRNLRDFEYRARDEFDVRYYDKHIDLSRVRGVDFAVSNWGADHIAHTMLSFELDGLEWLTVSIETRLEKGESYDPLKGIFKQFELIYVMGSERDLIRLRTNYRDEKVFLYPSNASPEQARALLTSILKEANQITEKPTFYHTLAKNCTSVLVSHINEVIDPDVPLDHKQLLTGYADELAYELEHIKTPLPFDELRKACNITKIANESDEDRDFSQTIRKARNAAVSAARSN
ncbi:MAG: DUF4105 domain-containing protein [Verrucomicrobiota bacterium]